MLTCPLTYKTELENRDETTVEAPFTIQEMLAQLDGIFPMDEAVIEGN